MGLKQQIQYIAQINEEYLTEGIRFFKNSKRIEKLIEKFENALSITKDPETKNEVEEYIRELKKAKLDFESVEQKYSIGDKEQAKEEYKNLRVKFANIVADINKETLKKFMIGAGLAAITFAVFSIIVPSHIPVQTPTAGNIYSPMPTKSSLSFEEKDIQKMIQQNNLELKNVRDKLKALKIFDRNQELLKKLAEEQIKIQGKLGT